jgi:hypothetical protein
MEYRQFDIEFVEFAQIRPWENVFRPFARKSTPYIFLRIHPQNPCSSHKCRSIHAPIELCAIDGT